jgi:hypothetical protein
MAIAVTPDLDDAVLLLNQGEQFFLPTHFFSRTEEWHIGGMLRA